MSIAISGSSITFPDQTQMSTAVGGSFRNRIINGDMRIDQRNAGASVTPANGAYTLDRWSYYATQASKFTVQRNAGSVTPPAGYTNYMGITSTSAFSIAASDYFIMTQAIEGFNVSDLSFGTANAKSITISFWVYSSLTGTFGGVIENSSQTRAYPFSYTISSANTWEQKFVTIAGDTTGTWVTDNGLGLWLMFSLGTGSTYAGTAGAWVGSQKLGVTGAVSVVGTNGATFYITGVQLEKGSTATDFERRPIGTELALCQRYYETLANDTEGVSLVSYFHITNVNRSRWFFKVTKRAQPTVGLVSGTAWASSLVPTIYPSVDNAGFYKTSTNFASSGPSQAAGLYADAEL